MLRIFDFLGTYKIISFPYTEKFFNYPVNPVIPFELNHITFQFSAIDWAAPNKIKYSYIVDGLDDKWSELSAEASADYRNIPAIWTFQIIAC